MPGYKGHLVGGVGVYGVALCLLQWMHPSRLTSFEWLFFTIAGSLFPDIDIKSKGQKYFYWVLLVLCMILIIKERYNLLAALSITMIIPMLVRHRGLFHRLWFVVGFPLIVAFVCSIVAPLCARMIFFNALFFILGSISHLWLDLGFRRMLRW